MNFCLFLRSFIFLLLLHTYVVIGLNDKLSCVDLISVVGLVLFSSLSSFTLCVSILSKSLLEFSLWAHVPMISWHYLVTFFDGFEKLTCPAVHCYFFTRLEAILLTREISLSCIEQCLQK